MQRLLTDVVAADLGPGGRTIWVSHLTDDELDRLRAAYPDFGFRPRIGTDLWLGDRGALRVTATVLDVHPVERGDAFGYRGRTHAADGHLLVVSGGTAHGIGLESPDRGTPRSGPGRAPSPAVAWTRPGWCGRRSPSTASSGCSPSRPHMQASMLFLPGGAAVPEVGDEVDVRVRFTATDVRPRR